MDFFRAQRTRTQRSLLLYGLFFLVVLAHMAVAIAVMALLLTLFNGGISYWVLILVTLWTLGSFLIGSLVEYRRLRAGGRAIAQRVGAVRVFIDRSQEAWEQSRGVAHQHEPEQKVHYRHQQIAVRDQRDLPPVYRRYYEIAEQLAIASDLRMPILYVLASEQGINGFVAGRHSQDMVLVVTQGALDKLSDEALYGLIGHEYGHILHGDAAFNLKLMVVLAGLQLLYDWSDPINPMGSGHSRRHNRQNNNPIASTDTQTFDIKTYDDWAAYWKTQSQKQQHIAKSQSMWLPNKAATGRPALPSIWTLIISALSFSSMASAQLIKHSFNRERELLADATSVQLTRSPAIIETLKAVHQDALGSRLIGVADINGLSHFFFASSGADLGEVSWFATHPSLPERMSAINASAYQSFATQIANEKRLNQQKIKQLYEQRRLCDWGTIKENSLSKNTQTKTIHTIDKKQSTYPKLKADTDTSSALKSETGLEFVLEEEVIVEGRLQVADQEADAHKLLKPWQAKPDSKLPAALISAENVQTRSIPHYILNHSHHPLGAQALIEAVMLCHQGHTLSTMARYDLTMIWHTFSDVPSTIYKSATAKHDTTKSETTINDSIVESVAPHEQVLPHRIDAELLERVACLDRRLDSALIMLAIKQLRQHDLSDDAISTLRLKQQNRPSHQYHQHYVQHKKYRTMLGRYQQGMIALFERQLEADLSKSFADKVTGDANDSSDSSSRRSSSLSYRDKHGLLFTGLEQDTLRTSSILSLWQALHLLKLLPALSTVLNDEQGSWQQVLQVGKDKLLAQLDPSGSIFDSLGVARQLMLILLAYRLSKDIKGQMISAQKSSLLGYNDASVTHYIVDLRRHARLIDIDLSAVSEADLQWLLLTAQNLNSVQLLALIKTLPPFVASDKSVKNGDNSQQRQQDGRQIDYNAPVPHIPHIHSNHTDTIMSEDNYTVNDYQRWLSTLHTVMLHDTIVSQDEYDCLILLAEHWLGVRQLF
ncbi:M48 family metalloprotease [Psychrobacter sp. B38]|uniref:M48 family metalloprotease n=1 Tax=Psychrobacter sp. B38 TaxID=3143538 RepID=UPI00320E77CE